MTHGEVLLRIMCKAGVHLATETVLDLMKAALELDSEYAAKPERKPYPEPKVYSGESGAEQWYAEEKK